MMLLRKVRFAAFLAFALGGGFICMGTGLQAQDPLDTLDLDPGAPTAGAKITDKIHSTFKGNLMKEAEGYTAGKGAQYNPKRAYEIYQTVAETGNPLAIYQVARFLILGEGVARDAAEGRVVLRGLARTFIQSEGFRFRTGLNPVTRKRFKQSEELKASGFTLATFKCRDGKELTDPKVLGVDKAGLRVMHSTGVASVVWSDLPAHVQLAAGYDIVSIYFEEEIKKALEKKTAKAPK